MYYNTYGLGFSAIFFHQKAKSIAVSATLRHHIGCLSLKKIHRRLLPLDHASDWQIYFLSQRAFNSAFETQNRNYGVGKICQ